ncbi:hypothetical protein M885DRAFT_504347 [Pelagophyceae sp. CCMP2097]|nr:hypothetical protein M885DRAFT_504347 [Pelagophyceae sp. CCMP2097]
MAPAPAAQAAAAPGRPAPPPGLPPRATAAAAAAAPRSMAPPPGSAPATASPTMQKVTGTDGVVREIAYQDEDSSVEMDDDEEINSIEDENERRQAMYGVPVGVKNTYDIDGMEDMTPEEYMAALNERTKADQRARRDSNKGSSSPANDYFKMLERR